MVKKKIFRKMRKFFILPLFILCLFSCFLCVNADSLIYQSNPFIIQGTATDNGESIADVSPVAFLFEKRGHSEVVNNEIVNADGQYLVNIGRQQWDEEWEVGRIALDDGSNYNVDEGIRSSNYNRIIPNTYYYNYNAVGIFMYDIDYNFIEYSTNPIFVSSANACWFKLCTSSSYGIVYNHDITLSLYYEDEDGYDQYYSYQVVSQVDTGNEILRSACSVYDVKTPNGTITRNVGVVDLSTLNWTLSNGVYVSSKPVDCPSNCNNIIADKYVYDPSHRSPSDLLLNEMYVGGSNININVSDPSTISGLFYYELISSTTEQGTSYSQNYYVDDFGSQYWLNSEEEFVEVGQAGLYGYNFDFLYSWYDNILRMIVAPIKSLGGAIVNYVKTGFVQLFTTQEVVNNVVVYHASPIAWFVFALMGIALAMSLTYFLVNLLRRSK